ncbi:MAG: OB-fold nucleic acid binding domain-containing protein, partial [Clostridia bacterium]|nr:OB-fold nucleic acid binding domain-containing protein [Clostridia bacterium]
GEHAEDNRPLAEKYQHITIAQACELALAAGETATTTEYTIVGTIVTVSNGIFGEMTVTDGTGSIYVYGCEFSNGTLYGDAEDKPVKGDIIVLKGVLKAYNGTPEMSTQTNRAEIVDFQHVKVEIDASQYPASTIAQVRDAAKGTKAKLTGVVAAIAYANGHKPTGIILVDETSSIYVYSGDIAQQVSVGNKIEIAGTKTYWILEDEVKFAQTHGYIGACQLDEAVLVSNDNKTNDFNKTWIEQVTVKELLSNGFDQNITSLLVKSTAVIKKAEGNGFTNYYINDLDNQTGSYVYTQCNGSDFAWLDEFDGQVCEVYYTALNAKSTAAGCVYRLLPVAVSKISNFSFAASEVPAFAIEYGVVDLFKSGTFGADPEIALPNSYTNSVIGATNVELAYTTSNAQVATVTKGAESTILNLVGNGTCQITVTATFGTHTASKTISVTLDPTADIQTPTVAEIIAMADGETVTLRGIVMSSLVNQTGFYLSDGTGMIAVRSTGDIVSQLKVGDEVVVQGVKKHVKKDTSANIIGQCSIDNAVVLANYYGNNNYDTSWFTTGKTIQELYDLDPNVDYTTNVYVLQAKVVVEETAYYSNILLQNADGTGDKLRLYCSSAKQYSWLAAYKGQVVTLEIAVCNWNDKTYYTGCVISVTDSQGNKVVNTLNFAE